jgi:hypothetical protein
VEHVKGQRNEIEPATKTNGIIKCDKARSFRDVCSSVQSRSEDREVVSKKAKYHRMIGYGISDVFGGQGE